MATLAQMQQEREQLLAEIRRRGGAAKAPKFAQQLATLEGQIRIAKGTDGGAKPVQTPEQTARQERRIEYLEKVDPKSPEIKELKKKVAKAGGGQGPSGRGDASDGNGGGAANPDGGQSGAGAGAGGDANPNTKFDEAGLNAFLDAALDGLGALDLSGAPKLLSDGDLERLRTENRDALYAEETKYLDRNRARSLEETKQEMAMRGIAYNPAEAFDPNSKDLYGRSIGAIEESYKADQQSALNRATTQADARMGVQVAANKAQRDSFADNAVKGYYSKLDTLNAGGSLLNTIMQKYGIDQATAQQILDRKSNERIAKAGLRARGGGGSGGGGGQPPGGFEIVS